MYGVLAVNECDYFLSQTEIRKSGYDTICGEKRGKVRGVQEIARVLSKTPGTVRKDHILGMLTH